jgi:hypothetical protein
MQELARPRSRGGVPHARGVPDGSASELPMPSGPLASERAIARRVEAADPDAVHIATEGPISCQVRPSVSAMGWPSAPMPRRFTNTSLRVGWCRSAGATRPCADFMPRYPATIVSTLSLVSRLTACGFSLQYWTPGVNPGLFRPEGAARLDLPRPIFRTIGRVAVEKSLDAFLSLVPRLQGGDRGRTAGR